MANLSQKADVYPMDDPIYEDEPHRGIWKEGEREVFELVFYTPRQWRAMPESQRPGDAYKLSGDAWYTFRPVLKTRDSG